MVLISTYLCSSGLASATVPLSRRGNVPRSRVGHQGEGNVPRLIMFVWLVGVLVAVSSIKKYLSTKYLCRYLLLGPKYINALVPRPP